MQATKKVFFVEYTSLACKKFVDNVRFAPSTQFEIHVIYDPQDANSSFAMYEAEKKETTYAPHLISKPSWIHLHPTLTHAPQAITTQVLIAAQIWLCTRHKTGDHLYIVTPTTGMDDTYEEFIAQTQLNGHKADWIQLETPAVLMDTKELDFTWITAVQFETDKKKKCELCNVIFETNDDWQLKTHNEENHNYRCDHCAQKFITLHDLQAHVNNTLRECVHCAICQIHLRDERFCTKEELDKHKVEKHIKCQCCNDYHFDTIALKYHETIMLPVICHYNYQGCTARFKSKEDMQEHVGMVHKVQNYVCLRCKESFSNLQSLNAHFLRAHDQTMHFK